MAVTFAVLTQIENDMATRTVAEKDLRKNISEKFPVVVILRILVPVPTI